jgi:hypothetical protein
VTTEEEVMRLLRRADPDRGRDHVPSANGTHYLAELSRRETTVTLIDTERTSTSTEDRHRWRIVMVAAAAVVAVGVAALILVARDDSGPPAPADTTVNVTPAAPDSAAAAEEVARSFVAAFAAGDADKALTYLSDDVIAKGGLGRVGIDVVDTPESAEDFRRTVAWNEASRYTLTVNGCEQSDDGTETGITVECDYDVHALGSDAIGLGPFPSGMSLTVRDDKIVASSHDESPEGLFEELWQPFSRWINREHPDDAAVMYTGGEQNLYNAARTDEALRLWEQRTAQFVQAVLTAREAYGVICATQAAQLAELGAAPEGTLDQIATWNAAAAGILKETRSALYAFNAMPTDTAHVSTVYNDLNRIVQSFEARADAAAAGDSDRLAELEAEYVDLVQTISSGPDGSGLDECVASLPS